MRSISRKNRAFTLVEILIVVVILGILAAIVVPQFAKAADDARGGNIASQLSTLQNAIELYRAREGVYPDFDGANYEGWDELIGDLDGDGETDDGANAYIKDIPVNPAHEDNATAGTIVIAATTGQADAGWVWDNSAGELTLFASYFDEDEGEVTPGVAANPAAAP